MESRGKGRRSGRSPGETRPDHHNTLLVSGCVNECQRSCRNLSRIFSHTDQPHITACSQVCAQTPETPPSVNETEAPRGRGRGRVGSSGTRTHSRSLRVEEVVPQSAGGAAERVVKHQPHPGAAALPCGPPAGLGYPASGAPAGQGRHSASDSRALCTGQAALVREAWGGGPAGIWPWLSDHRNVPGGPDGAGRRNASQMECGECIPGGGYLGVTWGSHGGGYLGSLGGLLQGVN